MNIHHRELWTSYGKATAMENDEENREERQTEEAKNQTILTQVYFSNFLV
jgi:hypothetical protein